MRQVVILGGGFGGVAIIKKLEHACKHGLCQATIVDRAPYHTFTPSLYEVATAEAPQKTIAIPFAEFIKPNMQFLRGEIVSIDPATKSATLLNGTVVHWDYLVIALGSTTAYFNIPGLAEHSLPLKSISDAITIKSNLYQTIKAKRKQDRIKIVVGGGGFTGIEFAAELAEFQKRAANQLHMSPDQIELSLIEALPHVLNGLDQKIIEKAEKRLETNKVRLHLGSTIKTVTKERIETSNGDVFPYDLFIWTGGVTASPVLATTKLPLNKKGQLIVNNFLQVADHSDIFVVGDSAGFVDQASQKPALWLAQTAWDQGKLTGRNLVQIMIGQSLRSYRLISYPLLIPLKGRYVLAATSVGNFPGLIGWGIQQFSFLRYLWRILPPIKALKRWNAFESQLEV